ncbi:solute carrier family 12 (potassium/chloride transporter), member 4/5/6, partial [Paragonimus westermani]
SGVFELAHLESRRCRLMSVQRIGKKFSVQSVGDVSKSARVSLVHESEEAYAGIPSEVVPEDIEAEDEDDQELNLFEDEQKTLPPMSNWFGKLAAYTGGIEPTVDETKQLREKQAKADERKRLGTFLGVFLPCCQNILGILLFVRVGWITGVAGALQSATIVIMCCSCTMLTALSMSAIATNGKVPAGGSYFMISRSIGPEFGGAVGLLFYLGTTIAAAMYLVGAVEVFLKYLCPQASLFGDITSDEALFNNTRVYGTILLILVMCCVLLGIKFVSRFATIGLVAVICSVICVYLGIFIISSKNSPYVCALGGRLLAKQFYTINGTAECTKNETGPIYQVYCVNPETATNESCAFFMNYPLVYYPAMPGLSSDNFFENFLPSYYRNKGEAYDDLAFPAKREYGQGPNIADVTTSFMVLLAIYFPCVTDLASPLFFAAICDGAVMRDKFGESYGGGLLVAEFSWPHAYLVLIGSCLSTIGAGLQSITGAPRLLQAIAQDNVMPFLGVFKVTTRRGEPLRAQILSYCIAQVGMLIASIDSLTPLITMFFLMCYGFVNLATMLNGFVREPSWRPRFRCSHWASKEWGDATRGLQMSAAKRAILKLGDKPIHVKNWRPQILVYIPLDQNLQVRHDHLLDLVYQLKAGHGLTLVVSILEGDVFDRKEDAMKAKQILGDLIRQYRIKGLPEVLVASNVSEGMKNMAQCAGLGNLRHNTLMVTFPEDWRADSERGGTKVYQFISTVRAAQACDAAMLVPKRIDSFPKSRATQMTGSVDVWCIVHDGGLLLLTSYLLMRNRVWRRCELRIFVVACEGDDTVNLKKDMTKFVYDLRINAAVDVVAMSNADLSAYVVQRTANMEARRQLLMQMKLSDTEARRDPQHIVDQHRKSVGSSDFHELHGIPNTTNNNKTVNISNSSSNLLGGNVNNPLQIPKVTVLPAVSDNEMKETLTTERVEVWSPKQSVIPPVPASTDKVVTEKTQCSVSFITGPSPVASARKPAPCSDDGTPAVETTVADHLAGNTLDTIQSVNEFTFSPSHPLAQRVASAAAVMATKGALENASPSSAISPGPQNKRYQWVITKMLIRADNLKGDVSGHFFRKSKSKTKRKIHSAARLNELIRTHSSDADLVIVNMPNPSRNPTSDYYYMDYVEALAEGLPCVLLVRGTGREVITAFSE